MKQETAQILGIVALGCAVVSWLVCNAAVPIFAIAAIVLAVLAIRGGAKKLGIASIIVAAIPLVCATVILTVSSMKLYEAAGELERIATEMKEECWACDGKGYVDCVFCVRGYLSYGNVCPFCNGRGVTICTICNGTGKPQ
jgi:hypothetical protein